MKNNKLFSNDNLIWIDLEMTGLNPNTDKIIEIAVIMTNKDLQILATGPVLAIHQEPACLAKMDDWNTKQHNASGLVQRVNASIINEAQAETETIAFLSQYVDKGQSPMCGNSICQDRRFLSNYMPELADFFHYRHIDVSTIKELTKRWAPQLLDGVKKTSAHLALNDIQDSIAELVYYRQHVMRI